MLAKTERKGLLPMLTGVLTGATEVEINVESLKQLKIELTCDPADPS